MNHIVPLQQRALVSKEIRSELFLSRLFSYSSRTVTPGLLCSSHSEVTYPYPADAKQRVLSPGRHGSRFEATNSKAAPKIGQLHLSSFAFGVPNARNARVVIDHEPNLTVLLTD